MGLFDKKYCDICGEKIGLFGNRKLEDGNLCKNCAAKLSPFFRERKKSTVEEISEQLEYRAENKERLSSFRPTKTFGNSEKVYVDEAAGAFIVTGSSNWKNANPDIISISQVTACNTNIRENKNEIFREGEDGKKVSYNPPRYEFTYDFIVEILVDSKWFHQIELELSDGSCPDSKYSELYHNYERQLYELSGILTGKNIADAFASVNASVNSVKTDSSPAASTEKIDETASDKWICTCGAENTCKFCEYCGIEKPVGVTQCKCRKCGWEPEDKTHPPKFCPECGKPF